MSFSRASSGVTNTSIVSPSGFDGLASNDDDQLFFVTSYSDFDKLGKSHPPLFSCYLSSIAPIYDLLLAFVQLCLTF